MNIPDFYALLVRARRDLWAVLETAPDEVLSRPVLPGERFHCIKDLILHIPAVEDSWLHDDILRDTAVYLGLPAFADARDGPHYADWPLALLMEYWRAVEASTLGYLETFSDAEETRGVDVGGRTLAVGDLLWHVMTHEQRHAAQITLLLRLGGVQPPALDVTRYLTPV